MYVGAVAEQPAPLVDARVSVARPAMGPLSGILLSLAVLFSGAAGVMVFNQAPPGVPLAGFGALFAALTVWSRRWFLDGKAVNLRGRVAVTADGVTLDGRTLTRREDVAHALASPSGLRLFEKGGGRIEVAGSLSEARAMLDAIGLGVRDRAATVSVNVVARGGALGVLPFFSVLWALASFTRVGPRFGWVALSVAAVANLWNVIQTLNKPKEIVVGLDAVIVRRTLGETQTLPLASIESTSVEAPGLVIRSNGLSIYVPCAESEAELVRERIEEAKEARAAAKGAPAEALLARDGREVRSWVQALRGLLAPDARQYRDAIDLSTLLASVEDLAAPPEVRAAAAVALPSPLDEPTRARLRVAIDTAADPRLRIALEAAEVGDEDRIEDALGALTAKKSD